MYKSVLISPIVTLLNLLGGPKRTRDILQMVFPESPNAPIICPPKTKKDTTTYLQKLWSSKGS